MPTISIIIPVYNVEAYLRQCLDSVLVDNKFTGQVICVNDGSTDGSGMILEAYAKKYHNIEIITQQNAGLSAARNAGLDRAIGEYVFFPDSDDWVKPGAIDKIMQQIDGEDVVYFNAKKYYEERQCYGKEIDIPNIKNMDGPAYFATIYCKPRIMPSVCVWGAFYRRLFLKENCLYNEPGIYHEDNYFTPQVLLAAKNVSSINECVYVYRIRQGGITSHVTEKHINDIFFIARNLYAKYEQIGNVEDIFYIDICDLYSNLLDVAYGHNINAGKWWNRTDSKRMLQCAYNNRSRKIAKLTFVHPYIAYCYMEDTLSTIWRRIINRFL